VHVPVHTEGKHDPDGILEHVHNTIEVETEATNIPKFLVLDIEGMKAGTFKLASDVVLPAGVTLVLDPTATVVHLSERRAATAEETAAAAPAPDAAAPAAPAAS
jgi:large subunit ribosomal protein L25